MVTFHETLSSTIFSQHFSYTDGKLFYFYSYSESFVITGRNFLATFLDLYTCMLKQMGMLAIVTFQ